MRELKLKPESGLSGTRQKFKPTPVVNLSLVRYVYFTMNKTHKEMDAIITYACFGKILVEISTAGAFLRRVLYGCGQCVK